MNHPNRKVRDLVSGHGSGILSGSACGVLFVILIVLLILFSLLRKRGQRTKAAAAKIDDGFLNTL